MKTKIAIYFLLLNASSFFSQLKVYTDIQKNNKTYPGKNFTISKVIDARKNKDNIGMVHKSSVPGDYYADFKKPLSLEIIKFYHTTFPKGSYTNEIIVIVNHFEIGHILTGKTNDTGFVRVNFDFYKIKGDSSYFIYNYSNTLCDVSDNIALSHSNRMKRILLKSVAKIDSALASAGSQPTRWLPDSLARISDSYSKKLYNEKDSLYTAGNYPRQNMVLLSFNGVLSTTTFMYGLSVSYMGQIKKHPRYLLGFHLNYSIINFTSNIVLPSNTSYRIRTSDFGPRMLKQLKNSVFFNSMMHVMIGKETRTSYTTGFLPNVIYENEKSNIFMGIQFDNGIMIVHPRNNGMTVGADFIFRATNSSMFDSDIGIKLSLGLTF